MTRNAPARPELRLSPDADEPGAGGGQRPRGDQLLLGLPQARREIPAVEVGPTDRLAHREPLSERGADVGERMEVIAEVGDGFRGLAVPVRVFAMVDLPLRRP